MESEYYLARALNDTVSKRTGGGGVVTAMLCGAMNKKIIDKALVLRSMPGTVFPVPYIARTIDEIMKSSGSKYVHINYNNLINKMDDTSAVVGNSCVFDDRPVTYYKIGLFTGLCNSKKAYIKLFKMLGIDRHKVSYIEFRRLVDNMLYNVIHMDSGNEIYFSTGWWNYVAFTDKAMEYVPFPHCMKCNDYHNRNSDISIGDYKRGWSVIIVRTEAGKRLLSNAEIDIAPLDYNAFTDAKHSLLYKIKDVQGGFGNLRKKKKFRMLQLKKILRVK